LAALGSTAALRINLGVETAADLKPVSSDVAFQIAATTEGALDALDAAATRLGAGTAVTGHYLIQDGELDIRGEVVRVADKSTLRFIEGVRGPPEQGDQLIEEFAQLVLGALASVFEYTLPAASNTGAPLEAFREYAKAAYAWRNFQTQLAIEHADRALEIDSTYAEAALVAARAHRLTDREAARRYIAIVERHKDRLSGSSRANYEYNRGTPPTLSEAYARAVTYNEARPGELRHEIPFWALSLNLPVTALAAYDAVGGPFDPTALAPEPVVYAYSLHLLGRHEDELAIADTARERARANATGMEALFTMHQLTALAALGRVEGVEDVVAEVEGLGIGTFPPGCTYGHIAKELWAHGRSDLADEFARKAADWFAENGPWSHDNRVLRPGQAAICEYAVPGMAEHAKALYEAGELDAAREIYLDLLDLEARQTSLPLLYQSFLARIEARSGNHEEARKWIDEVLTQEYPTKAHYRGVAAAAAIMGDHDRAMELLELGSDARTSQGKADWSIHYLVHWDRDFESLHGDPRFEEWMVPDDLPASAGPSRWIFAVAALGLIALVGGGAAFQRVRHTRLQPVSSEFL
jgi:tetratricopeptide (TPR) repeat protein